MKHFKKINTCQNRILVSEKHDFLLQREPRKWIYLASPSFLFIGHFFWTSTCVFPAPICFLYNFGFNFLICVVCWFRHKASKDFLIRDEWFLYPKVYPHGHFYPWPSNVGGIVLFWVILLRQSQVSCPGGLDRWTVCVCYTKKNQIECRKGHLHICWQCTATNR